MSLTIGAVGRKKTAARGFPDSSVGYFVKIYRDEPKFKGRRRTSDALERFISKVTPMANVGSASPGKLKESVQAKAAPAPKPVAPTNPAQAAAVAASRPVTAPRPAVPIKTPSQAKPAAAKVAVSPKPAVPKPPVESHSAATSTDERASALAFLGNLATELSKGTVNLPCFPDVVMRIRKALAEPEVGLTEIVKIVGTEPRLAARLLQVANSAAFNSSGKHLTDLRAAITRLGHRPVQSAAMSFAVKQLRLAPALRTISKPLNVLWEQSISVAAICQVVARRTRVSPEEAFLTGLLHGIGRLYILVRSVGKSDELYQDPSFLDMIASWHPAIGKAVLQNWGFDDHMCEALGDQDDHDRSGKNESDLTDILVVAVALARVLREPGPRSVETDRINSFARLRLTAQTCAEILRHAEHQLGSLHAALGC
jgi:HD-like signal output (HDOD) protein